MEQIEKARKPWHKVEMTGPAVIGLLVIFGGFFVAGPMSIPLGVITMGLLAWYRIATRD
jgi:hypothetical protein